MRGVVTVLLLVGYLGAALIVLPAESRTPEAKAAPARHVLPTSLTSPEKLLSAMAPSVAPAAAPASEPVAVDSAALEREVVTRLAHGPLARVLRRRTGGRGGTALADSIASALVREAERIRVAPSLLAAVLITENPRLEPRAVSSVGATGLMQVMPFHAGTHGCASKDLLDPDNNICHGARILSGYLKRTGDMRKALLRYNGCVRGTNTPRCHRYPDKVLRLAGKVRSQLLHYAALEPVAPSYDSLLLPSSPSPVP